MQGRLLGTYLGEPQLLRKPAEVGGQQLKNCSIDVGRDFGEIVDDVFSSLSDASTHFSTEPTVVDFGTEDEGDPETSWCEVLNQIY